MEFHSVNIGLHCSDGNFTIKRTHHIFFLENAPKISCLEENKKYFLRKTSMVDQRLNKDGGL